MWRRPLALFVVATCLAVVVGQFGTSDALAQDKKAKFKNKKKKLDIPPPAPAKPDPRQL